MTPAENALRSSNPLAQNARKTKCSRGHDFSTENTIVDAKGHRHCRTCSRATNTAWFRRKFNVSSPAPDSIKILETDNTKENN